MSQIIGFFVETFVYIKRIGETLNYNVASQVKYSLCLVLVGLLSAINAFSQYSEQDLIKEADELFDKGQYADAMPLYSQLLSLNPTNPVFNYRYGATALYGDAEKKEEAVKYLRFAAGKPNVQDDSWYFLGRAYHLNYQFQDAISAYEKYKALASKSDLEEKEVDLNISMAQNGQNLLSQIKEIKVLDKKRSDEGSFFRIYDLVDIGGKILVTPEELLSSEDKKRNHTSLIHFRGTGTRVYFSSYGKTGSNGLDIYHADVLPDGTFTEPVAVEGPVNTPYDEDFPYLHPDDKTFYFSSKGHGSMGGYDVYKSGFDLATGAFSKPVNLDFAVNTPDDDLFYLADSLNEMAYFASARSSEQGQLDVYKVLVKSAPLDITLIKGTFLNQLNPTNKLAKITTIDVATNEEVDVQYTDPSSGDYVLSFPRGGKYKFLVEAKDSDMIHAGLVDVPNSSGVNAFLQEMELISATGVEKLLINNLFDQTYDGDIMALAQKMLRQKAALDVNFDPSQQPEDSEDDVEKDPALAFADAGFSGGMSNELVLEQAEARAEEMKDRQIELAKLAVLAAEASDSLFVQAQESQNKAENLIANAEIDEASTNQFMFEAGVNKLQGETDLESAESSRGLSLSLKEQADELEEEYQSELARLDALRVALDENDYDAIYAEMAKEKEIRENLDRGEETLDVLKVARRNSIKADDEAQQLLDRAQSLRNQQEEIEKTLITRRTQSEKSKGKAKQQLDEEIAGLESEIESLQRKSERAFEQAENSQNKAYAMRKEYEMLETLTAQETIAALPTDEMPSISWTDIERAELEKNLGSLDINSEAVALYVQSNPKALQTFSDDATAMSFEKTFAPGVSLPVAETDSEAIAQNTESETESISTDEAQDDLTENAEESVSPSADAVAVTPVIGVGESDEAELTSEDIALAEEDPALEEITVDYDESLPLEKRIEAEEIKIEAAEDWIAIIDESIAQLESGAGGAEGAEEQLAEYRNLRIQKTEEIEQRKSLVAAWNEEKVDEFSQIAIERAEADLDSLSPSLVARLESKIPEYSTEISSIKSVSEIDRDYLPSLTEIEISGLSAPELAQNRIDLNAQLIADIDQILNEGIESNVSNEDLLEMRRVKMLEIKQDEEIINGTLAYAPRSQEAKDYAVLVSDNEPTKSSVLDEESDLSDLSPEIAATLQKEYSRDAILPKYEARMNRANKASDPQVAAAKRIELNEELLSGLAAEISILKAAIDATETPNPVLVARYNVLLKERSEIVDDLTADRVIKEEGIEMYAIVPADSIISQIEDEYISLDDTPKTEEELAAVSQSISEQVDEYVAVLDDPEVNVDRDQLQQEIQNLEDYRTQIDADLIALQAENAEKETIEKEIAEIQSISEAFVAEFDAQSESIRAEGYTEGEELDALATLNAEYVAKVDLRIDSLRAIDAADTPQIQAVIDSEIDKLEALSADKQQEADRLGAEVELLAISESPVQVEESIDEEAVELADIEEFKTVKYKSLNASIIQNDMRLKSDSLAELAQLRNEFPGEEERAVIDQSIDRIKNELAEGRKQSNLAEVEYFRRENERIIAQVNPNETSRREELIQLQKESAQLVQELTENSEGDSFNDQLVLIEELASVNAQLRDFDVNMSEVEPELQANTSTTALLEPSNHQRAANHTYMSVLQTEALADLSDGEKEALLEKDPITAASYSFSIDPSTSVQKELLIEMTEIDSIGLDLLGETPEKKSYLLATVTSDSLKTLEDLNAALASQKQATAIERSTEARRLLMMVSSQETEEEKEIVAERARKLEAEAEVLYTESAIAAERAEDIREQRAINDVRLSLLTEQLSPQEIAELDELFIKPGYTIIAPEETEELAEVESIVDTSEEEVIAESTEVVEETIEEPQVEEQIVEDVTIEEVVDEEPTAEVNEEIEDTVIDTPVSIEEESSESFSLSELKGNWLSMVEVIAEKDDFSDVNESMFAEGTRPLYSANNPIPVDPVMPDGLIFQVQVGAFRNPIPQDFFGAYAPIMGQKLDNGITRYRAGIFKKYNEAVLARNEIRQKGYSDAFVVVYVDGEKLTGEQAREILAQAQTEEKITVELVSGIPTDEPIEEVASTDSATPETESQVEEEVAAPDYYNDPEAAEAAQVEVITGLFYTVQVGVYSKPVKLDQVFNLTELNSELTSSGYIRYTSGRFSSAQSAQQRKAQAREKGVEDAFITAYYNGKRISLAEAEEILNAEGNEVISNETIDNTSQTEDTPPSTNESANGESYIVIVGTFAGDVPTDMANLFLDHPEWGIKKIQGPGNSAIYLSKEMDSLEAAKSLLEECRKFNISSATLGTMKDGQITSVSRE